MVGKSKTCCWKTRQEALQIRKYLGVGGKKIRYFNVSAATVPAWGGGIWEEGVFG
jgi:hypothetical protein